MADIKQHGGGSRPHGNGGGGQGHRGGGQGGYGQGGGLARPALTAIDAPYNFVPLSNQVLSPEWAAQVSHDLPFKDGISGEIHYTLTAHTPLLVGGTQQAATDKAPGEASFFQTPDGKYAIPGSSLKGMIRAVLEIATFSKMSAVDDSRWSVRDLTTPARPFYGNLMTKTVSNKVYQAIPAAGWLSFKEGDWHLTSCQCARVEHDDLAKFSNDAWWKSVPRISAGGKYARWKALLEIQLTPGAIKDHPHSNGNYLTYSKAADLGTGSTRGVLVFTGQPAARTALPGQKPLGKKHLEFIFHSEAETSIKVSSKLMAAFQHIHRKRDGYPGEEWEFWKQKSKIPVFYLKDKQGAVDSLGLALMYKLAYRYSIREVIGHTSSKHCDATVKDFATTLFGDIGDSPKDMLKGRVWFETAMAREAPPPSQPLRVVLNAPKPTYYPNYVKQLGQEAGVLRPSSYKTYMDADAEIRGWKRYPARLELSQSTQGGTDAVSTTLHPLESGCSFRGRVIFHNLKPIELGALLWVMTWGGHQKWRHSLGMGKPLGLGQVSLSLDAAPRWMANAGKVRDADDCINSFAKYMEDKIPKWSESPQISALCGMSDPDNERRFKGKLRHMTLEPDNSFVKAKQACLVLAEYPRQSWKLAVRQLPVAAMPTTWFKVKLTYTKGNRRLEAQNGKDKAWCDGDAAKALLAKLDDTARRKLEKGQLLATLEVKHIASTNWHITALTQS